MKCAYCGREGPDVEYHANYQQVAVDGAVPAEVPQCEVVWQCWERQFATEDRKAEVRT